jgi:hypothetical protein
MLHVWVGSVNALGSRVSAHRDQARVPSVRVDE